ncbi:hypothetical protein [Lysinibacillus xylanilyticus]
MSRELFASVPQVGMMSFVPKALRQVQKSPTSIGGEMNAISSHFSEGV